MRTYPFCVVSFSFLGPNVTIWTDKYIYPFGICHKNVTKNEIFCNQCNPWHDFKCKNISITEYEMLSCDPDDVSWFCINCIIAYCPSIIPFSTIDNETLQNPLAPCHEIFMTQKTTCSMVYHLLEMQEQGLGVALPILSNHYSYKF